MTSTEKISQLLLADESDVLERKASLSDKDAIKKTMLAFANDIAGKGGGIIIIGQGPDMNIIGLKEGPDEAQRILSDIARNGCHPSLHIAINICERNGKNLAIVDVPASISRPHFKGEAYVRQGSSNRVATDGEIVSLRSMLSNPKLRLLTEWAQKNKTKVSYIQIQKLGMGTESRGTGIADIIEMNDSYIIVKFQSNPPFSLSVPLDKLSLGYDSQNNRPQITFYRD